MIGLSNCVEYISIRCSVGVNILLILSNVDGLWPDVRVIWPLNSIGFVCSPRLVLV